jgi:hypothetical protein
MSVGRSGWSRPLSALSHHSNRDGSAGNGFCVSILQGPRGSSALTLPEAFVDRTVMVGWQQVSMVIRYPGKRG